MRLSSPHRTRDNKRENAALFFTRPTEMQSINVSTWYLAAEQNYIKKRESQIRHVWSKRSATARRNNRTFFCPYIYILLQQPLRLQLRDAINSVLGRISIKSGALSN